MNIMVVTQCFYPDVYAINDIVRSLKKRGHKFMVLTSIPIKNGIEEGLNIQSDNMIELDNKRIKK